MKILAIETSCDETAVSVVEAEGDLTAPKFKVLAHQISSQVKIHAPFGGVVPSLAKREHAKNLVPILIVALTDAKLLETGETKIDPTLITEILEREEGLAKQVLNELVKIKTPNIDAVAVTVGPGLEPALWVGINLAKVLSIIWNKPLIPTNHLEGHIISPLLDGKIIEVPAVALIASGGHTELVLVKKLGEYEKIGQTRDDAAGEAFDKVARLLGLPYPGGPNLSKLASVFVEVKPPLGGLTSTSSKWKLPRPMLNSPDYNFSFSGLKTAVLYKIKNFEQENNRELNEDEKASLAYEFEQAVVEVLVKKTLKAVKEFNTQAVIIGGGVIANTRLRETIKKELTEKYPAVTLHLPPLELATDNATMIAMAGYLRYLKNEFIAPDNILSTNISANGNLNF